MTTGMILTLGVGAILGAIGMFIWTKCVDRQTWRKWE